jgi:hypothetical protein
MTAIYQPVSCQYILSDFFSRDYFLVQIFYLRSISHLCIDRINPLVSLV